MPITTLLAEVDFEGTRLHRLLKKSGKQIPRGLNFTPTSAKTALVGDPCSPARDDKKQRAQRRT